MAGTPRNFLLFFGALLVCDAIAGEIAHRMKPLPEPDWFRSLERVYRVAHPVYHHGLRANTFTTGAWGGRLYPFHVNSLGFRDRSARTVPLESVSWRVLLIGDSVAEGTGVDYPDTFASRITVELATKGVETLNASAGSYSPTIYHRKIQFLIEDVGLDFDEVVVFLDISDVQDEASGYFLDENGRVALREPVSREPRPGAPGPIRRFLKRRSALARLFDSIKDRLASPTAWRGPFVDEEKRWARLTSPPRCAWTLDDSIFEEIGRPGLEKSARAMERLSELLDSRGKRLTIVVYPWPAQIVGRDVDSRHVAFWREWASSHEAGFVDLFPVFLDERDPRAVVEALFIPWDNHFNEAGHREFAEAFLERYRPSASDRKTD